MKYLILVINGTEPRRDFFAAAVHKVYEDGHFDEIDEMDPYGPWYHKVRSIN